MITCLRLRHLILLALLCGFAIPSVGADELAADLAAERTRVGIIEAIDVDAATVIVEGMRYRVALDVQVEINGSYGAFTMLQEGMQIEYTYRVFSAVDREIVRIQHIPDRFVIDRV